jgi:hypothetical protein
MKYPDGIVKYPEQYRRLEEEEWQHTLSTADLATVYQRVVRVVVDETDPFLMREAVLENRNGVTVVSIDGGAKYAVWGDFKIVERKTHRYSSPLDEGYEVLISGARVFNAINMKHKKL